MTIDHFLAAGEASCTGPILTFFHGEMTLPVIMRSRQSYHVWLLKSHLGMQLCEGGGGIT